MDPTGIDVHTKGSQLWILTEAGELIERRVRTEPPTLYRRPGRVSPGKAEVRHGTREIRYGE